MSTLAKLRSRGAMAPWGLVTELSILGMSLLTFLVIGDRLGPDGFGALAAVLATIALVANLACVALLARHRKGGVHLKASWIFSTNDALANVGVIVAGLLVLGTGSAIPDLVVGAAVGLLVLSGAVRILRL